MKILYLVPDLFGPPGGIARYCYLISRALLKDGVTLSVIALNDATEVKPENIAMLPSIDYHPCGGSRSRFVQTALLQSVRKRPTMLLVGHANFAILGWALARMRGVPVLTWAYGVEAWQRRSRMDRWALQHSDRVIAISHFTARQTAEANDVSRDRLRVLHNCVDPDLEHVVESEPTPSTPSLLTVARLKVGAQDKGHEFVIRALPELLARFPDLVYHIVGDGDGRTALQNLVKQTGVAQAVRFHGIVSDKDLARYCSEASIFVMPSRREGFGFVFIEAMALGTPAIGGNVDATTEVIVDGETGYLVDPTSVDAIVEAVSRLLADDALRRRMGQAAVRHVMRNFSFDGFQQQLLACLSEMVQ